MALSYEVYTNLTYLSIAALVAGIIVCMFTVGGTGKGSAIGYLTGLSAIFVSVLIFGTLKYTTSREVAAIFPFAFLMFSIGATIALVSAYYQRIVNGHISSYYSIFSFIWLLLTGLQLWMMNSGVDASKFYLIGTINTILVITNAIILSQFYADG